MEAAELYCYYDFLGLHFFLSFSKYSTKCFQPMVVRESPEVTIGEDLQKFFGNSKLWTIWLGRIAYETYLEIIHIMFPVICMHERYIVV